MPQFSDDIYLGPVSAPDMQGRTDPSSGSPAPMNLGIGPVGRVYLFDVVPVALITNGIATAQAVSGAGNLNLNGSLVSGGVATLDTPRAVQIVSTNAGDTTQTATFTGTDVYGQAMTQTLTFSGTTPVLGTKAFKTVSRVAISAAMTGNASAGTTDRLGLPVRVLNANYILAVKWNAVLAQDAGTFVAAVLTDPATATTGDVRGTYTPSNATDAAKRLVMAIGLPAIAVGPNATRLGAFGVTQA